MNKTITINTAVIFSAPQGWGKSRNAQALMQEFGCTSVVENWWPGQPVKHCALHLTHAPRSELKATARCHPVVVRGH